MHEVVPIRRPEDHPQVPGAVEDLLVVQVPLADRAQQAMKLVDGEHGGGRIVDRRRQRLDRDIDDDAKREGGVLLHGALRPEGNLSAQPALVDRAAAAVQQKKGSPTATKSPTWGTNSMTPSAVSLRRSAPRDLRPARSPTCPDARRSGPGAKLERRCAGSASVSSMGFGIDALDDPKALLAHAPHDADRAQQPRRIVDQEQKRHDRDEPKDCRDAQDKTWNVVSIRATLSDGKQQRENEQPHGGRMTLSRSSVVAMIRGVSCPLAT